VKSSYDVIVVGGGTAGIIAAIQSGRAGASTLLVEKQGILGGTMVVGGIPCPAKFFAHGRQVIAGIGWELCSRTWQETGDPHIKPDKDAYVNPAVFAALADETLIEAGVDILFHSMPASVERQENLWSVELATKTGLRTVQSKILVDCTGDANVVSLAGFEVERNEELQAATLVVHVAGYDAENLDYDAIQAAFEKEVEAGRMKHTDPGWHRGRIDFFLKSYGGNCIHVPDVDARTSEGKTQAEIEGRKAMLRMLRFFRKQAGLEGIKIISIATECGIRETVTIKGKKKITVQDYEGGRLWPDAVCYSFYPIDVHCADHIHGRPIKAGIFPTIPLGAMLPAESRGLIVAGRCIAGDWEANSAYRVEASCMAMGQSAGAAAALAAESGADFEAMPVEKIRELLSQHGAIVPPDVQRQNDVK
jgi:hypothetical protein